MIHGINNYNKNCMFLNNIHTCNIQYSFKPKSHKTKEKNYSFVHISMLCVGKEVSRIITIIIIISRQFNGEWHINLLLFSDI
jgi:hypothetical protein